MDSLTQPTTPNYFTKPTSTPNITPIIYHISLIPNQYFPHGVVNADGVFRIALNCRTDSPVDVTLTSANILYNGKLGNNYGNFNPELFDYNRISVSQLTIPSRPLGDPMLEIDLPKGDGSP